MRRLADPTYMKFPFRIQAEGADYSRRTEHVREQIEQVLFTDPGERVFRPQFGAGIRAMLFEPNAGNLREVTERRLISSLSEALQGEVDPQTLRIAINSEDNQLLIRISYRLATIGQEESHAFTVPAGDGDG